MKVKVVCFILLIFLLPTLLYGQINKGLVGHWAFDEKKGKLAFDDATKNNDSIHYIFNSIRSYQDPVRRKGIDNGALVFDGYSNWIERTPDKFTTPVHALTISVWVAPRAFEHGDGNKLSAIHFVV